MEFIPQKSGAELLWQSLLCREIDKHLSDRLGLTVDEMHCLGVLGLEKPMCVKNLSEFLYLSPSRTSKILLTLEHRVLVARSLDPFDHRKEQISLTELGKQAAERVLALYAEVGNNLEAQGNTAVDISSLMSDNAALAQRAESD